MAIYTEFSPLEKDMFATRIHSIIRSQQILTNRPVSQLKRLMDRSCFLVSREHSGEITGFIGKQHIYDTVYEIISWYVVPKKRNTGLADRLFQDIIKESGYTYIASTFDSRIGDRLKRFGFRQIHTTDLPLAVMVRYYLSRNIRSVLKYIMIQKSFLYIKP